MIRVASHVCYCNRASPPTGSLRQVYANVCFRSQSRRARRPEAALISDLAEPPFHAEDEASQRATSRFIAASPGDRPSREPRSRRILQPLARVRYDDWRSANVNLVYSGSRTRASRPRRTCPSPD